MSLSAEDEAALRAVTKRHYGQLRLLDIAIWIAAKNYWLEQAAKVCEAEQKLWLAAPNDEHGMAPVCHPAQTCYELALAIKALKGGE